LLRTYATEKIRNVAVVGHQGAGKTTLVEALLFASGATNRMGSVEDGNTVTDFDEEEHRRGQSVSLALAPVEWSDHKINLLDAPGYADFLGDVCAALEVADVALFVVSAVEGVEVQTEIAWKLAEQRGLPRVIFINKLDRERASFQRTLDQCKELFGAGVAPIQLPIGEEAALNGVVNLLADVAYTYEAGSPNGKQGAIPDAMEAEEHSVHDQLVEGIVVADDDLMERYLGDEKIEIAELTKALAKGVADGTVFRCCAAAPPSSWALTRSPPSSSRKHRRLPAGTAPRACTCSRPWLTPTSGASTCSRFCRAP
jgi:elongation factor G